MTDFYLVTGFLGAGKTTLLKNLMLLFKEKRIHLIINEYGVEGVDGILLKETGAKLYEITNGSIFCVCRLDKFEEVLSECMSFSPEILIVEASGLSDPSNIRKVLEQQQQEKQLCYRGCLCVVDAVRIEKVLDTARVCRKQLSIADSILINKTDQVTQEQVERVKQKIDQYCPGIPVHQTQHGQIFPEWVTAMNPFDHSFDMAASRPDITLQRAQVFIKSDMTQYQLEHFLGMFIEDSCRIKGFLKLDSGSVLVDCVGSFLSVKPREEEVHTCTLTVLATQGMPLRKSLQTAAEWYSDFVSVQFG